MATKNPDRRAFLTSAAAVAAGGSAVAFGLTVEQPVGPCQAATPAPEVETFYYADDHYGVPFVHATKRSAESLDDHDDEIKPIIGTFTGQGPFYVACITPGSLLQSASPWEPQYMLDVPADCDDSEGEFSPDALPSAFCSREEALSRAATMNRPLLDSDYCPESWHIVVELGEFPGPTGTVNVDFDRWDKRDRSKQPFIGVMWIHYQRPVRVVRPTAEELARYCPEFAAALEKGGAA